MILPDFLTQDKYGYIHLVSHRIGLRHVVDLYQNEGYTPERLLDHFPTLSLAVIHKVLAFYLENRPEVDSYVARCRAVMAEHEAVPQTGPDHTELRRRMEAKYRAESA